MSTVVLVAWVLGLVWCWADFLITLSRRTRTTVKERFVAKERMEVAVIKARRIATDKSIAPSEAGDAVVQAGRWTSVVSPYLQYVGSACRRTCRRIGEFIRRVTVLNSLHGWITSMYKWDMMPCPTYSVHHHGLNMSVGNTFGHGILTRSIATLVLPKLAHQPFFKVPIAQLSAFSSCWIDH